MEEAAMKRLASTLAILLLITGLTACGGSSGGGGSGPSPLTTSADVFSYSYDGLILVDGLIKTEDGLEIKLDDLGFSLPDAFKRNAVISFASDFSKQGDFMVGSKDTTRSLTDAEIDGDRYTGSLTITDKVYLGGKGVGLEYSEFGSWKFYYSFNGTINGSPQPSFSARDEDMPFYEADAAQKASFPVNLPAADQSFTGTAVGMYVNENAPAGPLRKDLFGTAAITIPAGTLVGSKLKIDFVDDFLIEITNAVTPTGDLNGYGATYKVGAPVNSELGPFTATSLALDGHFYGPSANEPTEAVGKFKISEDTSDHYIVGAFGVKK